MPTVETALRTQFFDYIFGKTNGYLCICLGNPNVEKKSPNYFSQHFFSWPEERAQVAHFIDKNRKNNVWFCTSLLEREERTKEACIPGDLVWSDLDACHPDKVIPAPSCVIESSPRRYQALWRTEDVLEPYQQEDYSKRIAYTYSNSGADPSGWDLTQLLRVPLTFNFKYDNPDEEGVPEVKLLRSLEVRTPTSEFEKLDRPANKNIDTVGAEETLPNIGELPIPDHVVYKFKPHLDKTAFTELYFVTPDREDDWSGRLWRLINICFEAGMDEEEVFAVALTAQCNKYSRDNRPVVHLWEDVLRAAEGQRRASLVFGTFQPLVMPDIISDEDIHEARKQQTFVQDYSDWATEATDAVPEYHQLAAFILLSSVIAGGVRLDTSYGEMVPNLWGLVLGDSTLTRKTTAMRMAMDMLYEIDDEIILATDGSAEGLLSGLGGRPERVSIYFKDEVSGFFDSINKKDYLAGMPEILTHLYDVPKIYTRMLRKETIQIVSPVFIFFGGGIRDKVYSLLSDEYVLSGFLPRFLVVSGDADISRIRRTGPGVVALNDKKERIKSRLADMNENYNRMITVPVGDSSIEIPSKTQAYLTDEAWDRYGQIEMKMVEAASDSQLSMLALPTFERMSRSLLKMSVILAASRQTPQDHKLLVEESDIVVAASYIQRWGNYSIDMLINSGKSLSERTLQKILATISKNGKVTKSVVMQRHHLTSRDAHDIINTLKDRGQITVETTGNRTYLKAVQ